MHGLLDEAERWAEDALRIATESEQPEALAFYAGQLINIRFEQGRLAELEPLIAQQVEANPGIPAFRGALVLARSEAGMREQALEVLAIDSASGFSEIPYDSNWLAGIAIYAQACSTSRGARGGREAARAARAVGRPRGVQQCHDVGAGRAAAGQPRPRAGPIRRGRAQARHAAERHEQMTRRCGWRERASTWPTLLVERGAHARALQRLLEQAIGTARDLGCAGIERRAVRLLGRIGELA